LDHHRERFAGPAFSPSQSHDRLRQVGAGEELEPAQSLDCKNLSGTQSPRRHADRFGPSPNLSAPFIPDRYLGAAVGAGNRLGVETAGVGELVLLKARWTEGELVHAGQRPVVWHA